MTGEEFTDVTFNDLDLSGTRISGSSEFSVVIAQKSRSTCHTKSIFYESGDYTRFS